jgi:cell wall-associated NlpC family hydrolase
VTRVAAFVAAFGLLAAPSLAAVPAASWAQPQIEAVTASGLFDGPSDAFRPDDPLTSGSLARLVAAVRGEAAVPPLDAAAPVSIAHLDATLVGALDLRDAARTVDLAARQAGLRPPARFGTEVVARLLHLRVNHPAAQDALELQPQQTATRAEAAVSASQILHLHDADLQSARSTAAALALPPVTGLQQRILQTAVSLIGFPYVWGGEDERTERGFDCSGFVWRVYKLARYADAPQLAATIRGRTAAELSAEVPNAQRIAFADLEPGDVLFFGAGHPIKPQNVEHAGIYLGGGWMIHASGNGVALNSVTGWYRTAFAWGRRPLAEAGLA